MAGMPPATVEVNGAVVQCLVRDQRPDLVDRPLVRVANGWDNATFRLGEDLAVRLPRRADAVSLILHEQRYLPDIARRSPVAVPVPVHAGRPTSAPQTAGRPLKAWPISSSPSTPAETGVPVNPFRGVPLTDRDSAVVERLGDCERYPQAAALRAVRPPPLHGRLWPRRGTGYLGECPWLALILSTAMLSNSDDNPRMFDVVEFGIRQILEG